MSNNFSEFNISKNYKHTGIVVVKYLYLRYLNNINGEKIKFSNEESLMTCFLKTKFGLSQRSENITLQATDFNISNK